MRCSCYEAALLGICDPRRDAVPLRELAGVKVTSASTLYVPPLRTPDVSDEQARRLGFDPDALRQP